jgi:hypothetical protein
MTLYVPLNSSRGKQRRIYVLSLFLVDLINLSYSMMLEHGMRRASTDTRMFSNARRPANFTLHLHDIRLHTMLLVDCISISHNSIDTGRNFKLLR